MIVGRLGSESLPAHRIGARRAKSSSSSSGAASPVAARSQQTMDVMNPCPLNRESDRSDPTCPRTNDFSRNASRIFDSHSGEGGRCISTAPVGTPGSKSRFHPAQTACIMNRCDPTATQCATNSNLSYTFWENSWRAHDGREAVRPAGDPPNIWPAPGLARKIPARKRCRRSRSFRLMGLRASACVISAVRQKVAACRRCGDLGGQATD